MEYDPTSKVITAPPSSGGPIMHPTHSGPSARVAGTAVMASWIIFSNLTLIFALVTSERRRKISFNLHIINLSLASLIMGCLVLPLHIDFELKGQWEYSDNVCRLWLISDLMVCTLSILIVGMMVFDRFVIFSCTSVAEGSGKYVFSSIVFITPWALACCFVIPVYLNGETGSGVDAINGNCYLNLTDGYSILLVLGGYFVPGLGAFGIMVATTLTLFIRKDNLNEMDWVEEIEDKGWQVLMSWMIATTVLVMWLPFNALFLILYIVDAVWPVTYLESAMWIAYANAGVLPLVWLVMPVVRQSIARLCCCCCRSKAPRRQLNFRTDYTVEDDVNVSMLQYISKIKESDII